MSTLTRPAVLLAILLAAARLTAQGPLPADPATDRAPFFDLGKGAGLPVYLRGTAAALGHADGVRGGEVRTAVPDLGDKDFTFDVLYKFAEREVTDCVIGFTGTAAGTRATNQAVWAKVEGPGFGGRVTFNVSGKPDAQFGRDGRPGPYLFRMSKAGDTLTLAVGEWKDGVFRPAFSRDVVGLKAGAPFLGKSSAAFFGGGATFLGVRLAVGGKPVDPGKPAPPGADVSKVPFVKVGAGSPLPGYLRAVTPGPADATGLKLVGAFYRTAGDGLLDKDFLLDLQFRFAEHEASVMNVGLGEGKTFPGSQEVANSVCSRVHGQGAGAKTTVTITGEPEQRVDCLVGGRQVFRIEKRGDTLTLAVGDVNADGAFFPIATRTIPRLSAVAPFLNKENSTAFFGGGGTLEAVRFVVNGKPASTAAVAVAAPPGKAGPTQIPPKAAAPAGPDPFAGRAHLIPVVAGNLPTYLRPVPDLRADEKGRFPSAHFLRTVAADLHTKDFTFDVLYHFKPGDPAILMAGLGDGTTPRGTGFILDWVGARLHSPALGDGFASVTVSGRPEGTLARVRSAGPHLFRLRKRGDVLTMALCVDFKGTFTPTFEQSLPDLKAATPFLTDKNATLFVTGGGVVEAVRLAVAGEPVETRDLALALPARVVEGQALRLPAIKGGAGGRSLALAAGPKGLGVTAGGEFTWTPAAAQVGRHEVRVRATRGKETLLVAGEVEVVSAADAKAAGGDLAKLDTLYTLPLASDKHFVAPGADGRSLLLLEGDRLRRLVGGGVTVREDLKLPARYERVAERAGYFVGLSAEAKALHLIDKKTLAVRRAVKMDYRTVGDLAPHPTKPVSYVCVEVGGDGPPYRILVVEERTGDVLEPPGFYGTWAAVSPDGTTLYAGYREIYQKGNRLLINPDRVHVVPEYGTFDALLVYDITGARPVRRAIKEEPGGNGNGVVLSADGKRLSYLSHVGYPAFSGNVPAWDPSNLDRRPVSYPAKAHDAAPTWVAFHPVLGVAATPAKAGAMCYDRETGDARPGLADLRYPPFGAATVDRVYFAPDGGHLLLACEEGGKRFLRRVRLNLTPAEAARVRASRQD